MTMYLKTIIISVVYCDYALADMLLIVRYTNDSVLIHHYYFIVRKDCFCVDTLLASMTHIHDSVVKDD